MILACAHGVPPGYAFCGQCGASVDAVRCVCGFVGVEGDLYCGGCGRDLRDVSQGGASSQPKSTTRRGLPRLTRLVAQAAADQSMATPVRKANLSQDEIRKMIAERRGKR